MKLALCASYLSPLRSSISFSPTRSSPPTMLVLFSVVSFLFRSVRYFGFNAERAFLVRREASHYQKMGHFQNASQAIKETFWAGLLSLLLFLPQTSFEGNECARYCSGPVFLQSRLLRVWAEAPSTSISSLQLLKSDFLYGDRAI